jgi:hypothetical protein
MYQYLADVVLEAAAGEKGGEAYVGEFRHVVLPVSRHHLLLPRGGGGGRRRAALQRRCASDERGGGGSA